MVSHTNLHRPEKPELVVNTDKQMLEETVEFVIQLLIERNII